MQSDTSAITLYGARLDYRQIEWLGVELFLLGAEETDVIWSGDRAVSVGDRLPDREWFFLDLGAVYVAIHPLGVTRLGDLDVDPVAIHRYEDGLRITIENYDGPSNHFWKYAVITWEHPEPQIGPFFNGNLNAGFAIETADASDWPDFAAFRRAVSETTTSDQIDCNVRVVTTERNGRRLSLAVDRITFEPVERSVDGVAETYTFLEAQLAVQPWETPLTLQGDAVTSQPPGPWVIADGAERYITNPTPETVSVRIGTRQVELGPFESMSVAVGR